MATHRVLDASGHSEHVFDPGNPEALATARLRFETLTGHGYRAAVRGADGAHKLLKTFDPLADTLFIPPMQGG